MIEASVTIKVAAYPGKALTRKAASESPARVGKLAPAKSASYTTATKPAAHMSATESTAHMSATEPAAHMSATESATVASTATVSTATSAARKRVGGRSSGESGSDSENDHALA
jgi:hypothetical protein